LLRAVNPILGLDWLTPYRPNVVLFGEAMAEPAWTLALEAARCCDCMLVVGTSGLVFPAATLPLEAGSAGARVIAVGPEEGDGDWWLKGTAAEVLPALLDEAFGPSAKG
jgi:NAD-dependent deacetylase